MTRALNITATLLSHGFGVRVSATLDSKGLRGGYMAGHLPEIDMRCTQIRQLVYIIAQGLPYKTLRRPDLCGSF